MIDDEKQAQLYRIILKNYQGVAMRKTGEIELLHNDKDFNRIAMHLLQSIKGVGDVLSLTMLYEIGNINRFATRQ